MSRKFSGDALVIASHNEGKRREIAELLHGRVERVISARALGLPEPEETADSFEGNAELKARAAAIASGLPALADDSGLCVHGLNGAPGIFSARWAIGGGGGDFGPAMARIAQELGDNPDRTAHFTCALSMAWPDGHCETVVGEIHGSLVFPPAGSHGFGYDPIFRAAGHARTFGEMQPAEKHAISHRSVAFQKLLERCF